MIVWINGTYGVGKTTVARALREMFPANEVELLELDNYADMILERILKKQQKSNCLYSDIDGMSQWDMQYFEEFRKMIEEKAHKTVVVDTAITEKACKNIVYDYLLDKYPGLLHIILVADEELIKSRIKGDNERNDKSFALVHLKGSVSFMDENFNEAIRVKTDNRDVYDIVREIMEIVKVWEKL